jgi:hypothetical protein
VNNVSIITVRMTEKSIRRQNAMDKVDQLIAVKADISLILTARRDYIKATAQLVREARDASARQEVVDVSDLELGVLTTVGMASEFNIGIVL